MIIIASISIHDLNEDKITKMILSGADMIRYNLSYYEIDDVLTHINTIQRVKEELNSHIKIIADLPTNKPRLGDFENKIFTVKENDEITLASATYSNDCYNFIPVNTHKLGTKLYTNQMISLANGRMAMLVTQIINDEMVKVKMLNNGIIKSKQTFNANFRIDDSEMICRYKTIIEKTKQSTIDKLALSYLNKNFISLIKELPQLKNSSMKLILKIENEMTDTELNDICKDPAFNIILIDRGEIGVNMPFEKIGLYQKKIIATAKKYSKTVLISTQILDSVIENYIPTRSDISDLTNIILDGAHGIILNKETSSNSSRPAYAISTAKKIINEVTKNQVLM